MKLNCDFVIDSTKARTFYYDPVGYDHIPTSIMEVMPFSIGWSETFLFFPYRALAAASFSSTMRPIVPYEDMVLLPGKRSMV